MSELKVYHCNEWHNEYTEFYIKSEADKVIADLEESHKKEVGQLLIEIAQLKKEIEFMHSNCKWDAGDGCARLLGEKLAIINENAELKEKSDKLHSGLKCLVMRDLIKDCPEKKSIKKLLEGLK